MQTATPVPALVPPETRRLAYLPNWALRAVFLLGVMVALASQATAAPVVFEASGEFENGLELTGTVTIDTATGKVLSADLSLVEGSVVKYVFDGRVSVARSTGPYTRIVIEPGAVQGFAQLWITVPGTSLVGYDGSKTLWSYAGEELSGAYLPDGTLYTYFVPLISGSLEPN
jgi:hypothetical protein